MTTSDVELADGVGEPLDLEPLHRHERRDSSGAQRLDERRVGLERVESGAEIRRQLRAGVGVVGAVGIADDRIRWCQPALDPVEPGAEDGGGDQMCAGAPRHRCGPRHARGRHAPAARGRSAVRLS